MYSPFKKFDLTGKTAIVTGGGTGLGYYITRALMGSGAKVVIVARREEVLADAVERLKKETDAGEVSYFRTDLGKRDDVTALIEHMNANYGGADIVICNAVLSIREPLDDVKDESLDQMLQVNLASNFALIRAFLPSMRQKKWGRVIFSSSINSITGLADEGVSSYAACKGAVDAYCKTAAAETGHDGITFNSIQLGVYYTELTEWLLEGLARDLGKEASQAFVDSIAGMSALGRMGRSEEVEGVVQFLASDAGSYCTGSNLVLDGGVSAMMRPNPPPEDVKWPKLKF